MWQSTVRVERARTTAAPPDVAWSLLSSPQAWSARPRPCMTFDLGVPAGLGGGAAGTWFYLTAADGVAVAAAVEVSTPIAGQLLRVQPSGGLARWELSVEPGRRGTAMRIAATRTVPRQAKIDAEADMREDADRWLATLAAVAEGRSPWPGEDMPPGLREACLAGRPATAVIEASASVLVDAHPDSVGRAVGSLDVLLAVQTEAVVACGYIAGTPAGQAGGVRYFVYRLGDGGLLAVASLVAALSPTAMMTRQLTAPFGETTYAWSGAGGGTRLDLTQRFPGSSAALSAGQRQTFDAAVTAMAARYQAAIGSLRPGR